MDKLTFRVAEPQDYDEVVKLSEGIYGGHDYLPIRFHRWLKQPNRVVLPAFLEDKLIGLQAHEIVDDGKTAVGQAKRIHADYRGQGYGTCLSDAAKYFIGQRYPNVCRKRVASRRPYPDGKYRELLAYLTLSCQIDKNALHPESLPKVPIDLNRCTKQYLSDVILSRPTSETLFHNKTHVIDMQPYEAIRSNIDYMLEEGDQLFVEQVPEGSLPKSFSHGRFSPRTQVQHWSCSIYAQDPALYEAHLLKQIESACNIVHGNFIFASFQDECFANQGNKLFIGETKFTEQPKIILYEQKW